MKDFVVAVGLTLGTLTALALYVLYEDYVERRRREKEVERIYFKNLGD